MNIPPGPHGIEILRVLSRMKTHYPEAFLDLHRKHGDIFSIKLPFPAYFFINPKHVHHILKGNHKNYRKGKMYEPLRPILGEGLVTSEGEMWKKQRRLIAPEFHMKSIQKFSKSMVRHTEIQADAWVSAEAPVIRDVAEDMMSLTLGIVGETLFGSELEQQNKLIADNLYILLNHALNRMLAIVKLPENFPTPANRRAKKAAENLDRIVLDLIHTRRSAPLGMERSDVLSKLIHAKDVETEKGMSDQQLVDEIKTLILAGHETTSLALSWSWYLLSENPDAEKKLHDELAEVLGGRSPTFDDLPHLQYTKWVIQESLRLYPPIPVLSRESIDEDEIGGFKIPANHIVQIAPYVTHRDPQYWSEPDQFKPERFKEGGEYHPELLSYFPFIAGPRGCVGEQFAMIEAQLILATLAQRFKLRCVPGRAVMSEAINTLRPKNGLWMSIEKIS